MTYQPDGFNMELTTCCPLRCPQCYCSLEDGRHLPLAKAIELLNQAAALGVTHVELSGGETMCYPHLYEVIQKARQLNIAPSIATSGWHFDDTVLQKLIEAGIEDIYISLNGPTRETNSLTRDGYELSIHALEVLQRSNFPNRAINWVMHRASVPFLPDMIRLAEHYGVDTILIIEPQPTSAGRLDTYPTAKQIIQVADLVKHQRGPVELSVHHCFSPLLALSLHSKLWGNRNRGVYKGCTAGLASFSVSVDGHFSPCRHLLIYEDWPSLTEYWENSLCLKELRLLDHYRQEPCFSCAMQKYCRPCPLFSVASERELRIRHAFCQLADHLDS